MKFLFVLLATITALPGVTWAQRITYLHDDAPAFSITYPVGWEIRTPRSEERNVISAYPTDGSLLWQGMWIMSESTSLEDALARLQAMELGLFKDAQPTQDPWTEKIGDLEVRCYRGRGLYQGDKPVETFMALFQLPDQQVGVLGYIGDPESLRTHAEDLRSILGSLRVVP